ncbi:uncharacterized protein LOC111340298 [Stylophora pistillata]|uniref:Short-chain collagen C4 n=1 Tax=Stylophora pistillata TaxID=50429 RepID=A0A2B4RM05_STYPI|nr:uncharacterized protein LOC111340298 [Stylophora pistillata]PFX17849.1 hypothetical protein AWC38_SpisGene17826 [Stylophora pistillata]
MYDDEKSSTVSEQKQASIEASEIRVRSIRSDVISLEELGSKVEQLEKRKGRTRYGGDGVKGERGEPGSIGPQGPPGVKGPIGGNYHGHTGGGSNHICLPEQPLYARYDDKWESSSSAVYGAEYAVGEFNPFKKPLNHYNAPCVVCHLESRGSRVMIPARNECPTGWTLEYWGYLMTKSYSSGNTDFIYVDEDAEYVPYLPWKQWRGQVESCVKCLLCITMWSLHRWP